MENKTYITPSGLSYNLYNNMLSQTHLLIAGKTGSGKSVLINGLMYTALFNSPLHVQFILIDPKRVELNQYRKLPHTINYASEPGLIYNALLQAINICDNRFKQMQVEGTRKYNGSNIYLIIDELADLMTTDGKRVKPIIQRIAQIGRAANIHIILATQCPISKVIPTEIKVNFDSIIGLKTRSKQDSKNILGFTGCEKLPEYGNGYYLNPALNSPVLVKIPLYPDNELNDRIKYWLNQ